MALDPSAVDRALAEASRRAENLEYFFDRITSPAWIDPLRERGLFAQPPEQYVDDGGLVRAPSWAQSRYIARVASAAPSEVVAIVRSTTTNNETIWEDFVDAALALPSTESLAVAKCVSQWLRSTDRVYYRLPSKLVELICRFARDGLVEGSTALLTDLFDTTVVSDDDPWRRTVKPRIDHWLYDHLLAKAIECCVPHMPLEFIKTVRGILLQSVPPGYSDESDGHITRLLRVRISSDEDRATDIVDSLISTLRDASARIRLSGYAEDGALLTVLAGAGGDLTKRIAMHAFSEGPEPNIELVGPLLDDVIELGSSEPCPEYQALLRRMAGKLHSGSLNRLLGVVDKGPDVAVYRKRRLEHTGKEPSEDDVRAYIARWQIARLELLLEGLDQERRGRYESLVAEYGQSSITVSGEVRSFVGPTSPVTAAALAEMTNQGLVTFLRDWKPDGRWDGPSLEGLARAVQATAEADPGRLSEQARAFTVLGPENVRGLLMGLEVALRAQSRLAWGSVLDLVGWVLEQPTDASDPPTRSGEDRDPGWGWTRRHIASLLETGLHAEPEFAVPIDERERVWSIVAKLCEDADPTATQEGAFGGQNMDPATLALNTTRPRALGAAIAYAVWLYSALQTDAERDGFRLTDRVPEVVKVLKAHLDPGSDPSPTVRSVYGQFYSNLFAMDSDWAADVASRIFPYADSDLREAAWGTYVIYTSPYKDLLTVLRDIYLRSAELCGADTVRFRWANDGPDRALGKHLAAFYWSGLLALDDEIVASYWSRTGPAGRRVVLARLGRLCAEAGSGSFEAHRDRAMEFWEWARGLDNGSNATELAVFGWWLAADELPLDWRLREFGEVLDRRITPEPDHCVWETLSTAAPASPRNVVIALDRLLVVDARSWTVNARRSEIETILRGAVSSGDAEAALSAEALGNRLGILGHREFRSIFEAG